MKVFLHIGVHKTGSSALQAFLHRNARQLQEHGVLYDRVHKDLFNHHHIVGRFAKDEDSTLARQVLREMLDKAQASQLRALLISSEMLTEGACDRSAFLETFKGQEIEVIAYIRRPDEMIVSAHSELVKSSVQRWKARVTERPLSYDPTYIDVLSYWMQRPDLSLRIAPYDRSQWPQRSLFLDFLLMLGIDDGSSFDLSTSDSHANRSLPAQLTELLRQSNSIETTAERHGEFASALYRLWAEFPDLLVPAAALTPEESLGFRQQLKDVLPRLRPYFRTGFDEKFLTDLDGPGA